MKFPIRIPKAVTKALGKAAFKFRRAKPDLFFIGGVLLGGGAIVMTAVDTWKGKETLQKDHNNIKKLKEEKVETPEKKKELSTARKKFGVDIIKTYWKPVALSAGSLYCGTKSHKILKRQAVELATMCASLAETLRQYREKNIKDNGAEKDQEYMYGVKTVDTIDEETGETVEKIFVDPKFKASIYARWLTEGKWDAEHGRWIWLNNTFTSNKLELEARLRSIQASCNDILNAYGFMTLNEVYRKLHLPLTEAGQHVGWVKGGFTDGSGGDDFIDFGVFPDYCDGKYQLPVNKRFLDPRSNQRYPLLDFNCVCIDKIWSDIEEYDNSSLIAYDKRRTNDLAGSKESLDRFFRNIELYGD